MKCTVCRNTLGEKCTVHHENGIKTHGDLCPSCQDKIRAAGAKVVSSKANDTCAWCGKDLSSVDFCWADGVDLYCSMSHGAQDCRQTPEEFMDHAECVGTEDIGIKSPKERCNICDEATDVIVSTQEHGPICVHCNNELQLAGREVIYNVDT